MRIVPSWYCFENVDKKGSCWTSFSKEIHSLKNYKYTHHVGIQWAYVMRINKLHSEFLPAVKYPSCKKLSYPATKLKLVTCSKSRRNNKKWVVSTSVFFFILCSFLHRWSVSILFLTPPMLQNSDLERSDQNCHFKSDNYILIPRMPMLEN